MNENNSIFDFYAYDGHITDTINFPPIGTKAGKEIVCSQFRKFVDSNFEEKKYGVSSV